MGGTDDLAARLRAAIEERRAVAEAATQGEWIPEGDIYVGHPMNVIVDWVRADEDEEHIVANQPSQTIRDCEAHRVVREGAPAFRPEGNRVCG